MKVKKIITAIVVTMLLAIPAGALSKKGKAAKANSLEVSFNYQRQAGPGSNQYAVWIENEKGEVVKTYNKIVGIASVRDFDIMILEKER